MRKVSIATNTFILLYNNVKLNVSTGDQIRFRIEFPDGREKELAFEIDNTMDLSWNYIDQGSSLEANDIGKLIENKIMKVTAS